MNRDEIEKQLNRAAQENASLIDGARTEIAEEKGKSADNTHVENEKLFCQYVEAHSEEDEYEYLVRGAKLRCRRGSHIRKLNLPQCHGVYIGENPVIHEYDCVEGEQEQGNISWFGICRAARANELSGEEVRYELTEENSADGTVGETELGKKCQPIIVGVWQDVYDKTRIMDCWDGDKENQQECCTVTTGSFLVCNYGGIIEPITSGQEYDLVKEDLGNNCDDEGNDRNDQIWKEVEERRREESAECENADCFMAHERHTEEAILEGNVGNVHGSDYFTIVFQYEDGEVIDEQEVRKGEKINPPQARKIKDYVFKGWDKDLNDIAENAVLTAVYEEDIFSKIDKMEIEDYEDAQLQTTKYVAKELLKAGYHINFVCAVLGNVYAEGGKAGFFESSNYDQNKDDKPIYLIHMDKCHHYRPGSPDEKLEKTEGEHVSGHSIYELEAGTSIFSKQLAWDSKNNKFICDDFYNHKFGFGMCQWTDPGTMEDLGRLPKLIIKYLDEFGKGAYPSLDECCGVETAYLLEELQDNKYSKIAGIHKEECSLEMATSDFLEHFEHPDDWESKVEDRTKYAKRVLNALYEVGVYE